MKQLNLYWLGGGGGSSVPDGRTVTPINDVTLLQQCAGIANPTYTSLSQILADTGILQTILSNQNAVNYLVRCTDFIKQKSVPTMTSDTTPSGLCFTHCPLRGSGYEPYRAFDNTTSTYFYANGSIGVGNDLGYKFTEPVKITKIYYYDNGLVGKIKVQGSNDGITYTDITGDLLVENRKVDTTFENNNYYQYYRIYVTQVISTSTTLAVYDMNFYTDPGFTDVEDAMRYIGMNNYAADTLLADSDWHDPICDSAYFERVLNVKVPKMTSATTPSGKVIFNGTTYEGQPYYSFNSDLAVWKPYGTRVSYKLGYVYPEAIKIHKVVAPVESIGKLREVEASNDETNWTEIANYNGQAGGGTLNVFGAAQYTGFRVYAENTSSSGYLGFGKWQFYGRRDV